jgi:hypothetical protein
MSDSMTTLLVISGILGFGLLMWCTAQVDSSRLAWKSLHKAKEAVAKQDYDLAIACCN